MYADALLDVVVDGADAQIDGLDVHGEIISKPLFYKEKPRKLKPRKRGNFRLASANTSASPAVKAASGGGGEAGTRGRGGDSP